MRPLPISIASNNQLHLLPPATSPASAPRPPPVNAVRKDCPWPLCSGAPRSSPALCLVARDVLLHASSCRWPPPAAPALALCSCQSRAARLLGRTLPPRTCCQQTASRLGQGYFLRKLSLLFFLSVYDENEIKFELKNCVSANMQGTVYMYNILLIWKGMHFNINFISFCRKRRGRYISLQVSTPSVSVGLNQLHKLEQP